VQIRPYKVYGRKTEYQKEMQMDDMNMMLLDTLPVGHTVLLTADVLHPVTLDVLFHAPALLSVESIEFIKALAIDCVCGRDANG
jgi:hypothetical protein